MSNILEVFRSAWEISDRSVPESTWVYGRLKRLNSTFFSVLGCSISEFIENKKKVGRNSHVLNVLGDLGPIRELGESGIAVSLQHPAGSEDEVRLDFEAGRKVVSGNVLKPSTWKKVRGEINNLRADRDGFGLILFRPVGGMRFLTEDPRVHYWLLNRLYSLTSRNYGTLLLQLPESTEGFTQELIDQIGSQNSKPGGIKTYAGIALDEDLLANQLVLRIDRTPDSPNKLPEYFNPKRMDQDKWQKYFPATF